MDPKAHRVGCCLAALAVLGCPSPGHDRAKQIAELARRAEDAADAHRREPVAYDSNGLPPALGVELGLQASVFDEPPVPWSYPDRVWSVRGLLTAAEALIDSPSCNAEDGAPPVVLVRGRVSQLWSPYCPVGARCPPQYAWAILADSELEDQQLGLRVVDLDLPIDPSEDALWRSVPNLELTEGGIYVFSGRIVRLDWFMLPERFGLELFGVTADDPRAERVDWQQARGSSEHRVAREAAGLGPVVPKECEIPPRFANPAPPRSTAPIVPPTGIDDAVRRADAATAVNDIPRADYYLRWALLSAPERGDLWIALARLQFAFSPESALAVLEAGIAKNPLAADLYSAVAMHHVIRLRNGEICGRTEPLGFALRAVELAPDDPTQLYWLAKVQVCAGQRRDASETLERLLARTADGSALVPWMVDEARCMRSRLAADADDTGSDLTCTRFKQYSYFWFDGEG